VPKHEPTWKESFRRLVDWEWRCPKAGIQSKTAAPMPARMHARVLLAAAVGATLLSASQAFTLPPAVASLGQRAAPGMQRQARQGATQLAARFMRDRRRASADDGTALSRKELLYLVAAGGATLLAAPGATSANPGKCQCGRERCECPVVVIGAAGGTGGETVRALLRSKTPVVAATRRPVKLLGRDKIDRNAKGPVNKDTVVLDRSDDQGLVRQVLADALLPETLPSALEGARAVIFCAGSRQKVEVTVTPGTNPGGAGATFEQEGGIGLKRSSYTQTSVASAPASSSVEDEGLLNVAKECVRLGIPKLVVVSSICAKCQGRTNDEGEQVDRGTASCDTCYRKQDGEEAVRDLYASAPAGLTYSIVRPGLLSYGERRGVGEVEFNQGTTKSGIISRADLAEVVVNAASSDAAAGKSFEVYYADTAQPVDMYASLQTCKSSGKSVKECFFGEGFDESKPLSLDEVLRKPLKGALFASGTEVQGSSYPMMFSKLRADKEEPFDLGSLAAPGVM
jgi:nucleoside-diphosphate-sugar epimerase